MREVGRYGKVLRNTALSVVVGLAVGVCGLNTRVVPELSSAPALAQAPSDDCPPGPALSADTASAAVTLSDTARTIVSSRLIGPEAEPATPSSLKVEALATDASFRA